MSPLGLGPPGVASAAVESAVDAYATRVLQASCPPETYVDTSLGPYVTSVLRCTEIRSKDQVTTLAEFDSLLELLEDQCNLSQDVATDALKTIAHAVVTGVVPQDSSVPNCSSINATSRGLYSFGGANSLDSFQSMEAALPSTQGSRKIEQIPIDPYTPNSAGGPSPLKPDNLIPVDLLGFLDDPSSHQMKQWYSADGGATPAKMQPERQVPAGSIPAYSAELVTTQERMISADEEAFPPLGASSASNSTSKHASKKGRKSKGSSKTKSSDKELAAALFRPSRPRQNSIEKADSSPLLSSLSQPRASIAETQQPQQHDKFFQQQWDSCVEILLSMNADLSEEAAAEAGLLANTDINIAQYIVDSAMSAPPVCRHMLHDGCYRSDCQFSHDVEGHTCLFWMRGRCTKPTSCKFLHGFHPKLIEGIQSQAAPVAPPGRSIPVPIVSSTPPGYPSTQYSAPIGYTSPDAGFAGFSSPGSSIFIGNSGMASSWSAPGLVDRASLSTSLPSGASGATSFANIASRGYDKNKFVAQSGGNNDSTTSAANIPTVRIPQDLWNPHENRDSSAFFIADPLDRYRQVSMATSKEHSSDVIDLHFQSTKTFGVVLEQILPQKLAQSSDGVWVVTGTGHHVGSKTHQKGGGALQESVIHWLQENGYKFAKGKDRNGLGGAVFVTSKSLPKR